MEMKKVFRTIVYIFAMIGFVLTGGYFAVKLGITKTAGIIDEQREHFLKPNQKPAWAEGEEWQTFKTAVVKDVDDINRAAKLSGVPARIIVAQLVSEQLRLFYTNRELFKTVFAPLKVLGNQSQFSWGVMGLKEETAEAIEAHLKDRSSPFYLGKDFESLLDFETANPHTNDPFGVGVNHDQERFERITDENSRFYSYLYTGLYLKQIIAQWKTAGYDIARRPDILSTLFNIGFEHSKPNTDPKVGGSEIQIGITTYSFGGLSAEFYQSDELSKEFPR